MQQYLSATWDVNFLLEISRKVEDKLESGKLYIILVNVLVQQWQPFSSSTKQHQRLKDEATVTMQIKGIFTDLDNHVGA